MKRVEEILIDDRLWTLRDVARFLGVGTSWVYKRAEDGSLPSLRSGALLRFDPGRVRAYARGEQAPPVIPLKERQGGRP